MSMARPNPPRRDRNGTASRPRSGQFAASPVLGLRLPMWRSKLVVFLMFAAFVALAVRAAWIQGPGNQFYEAEGKKRFQRTLELPATRGKILDRNGLVLATSLPVKAIWAVPEDVPNQVEAGKIRQLARLLGMSEKDLGKKLSEDKGFVYLKRQVLPDVADKIAALKIDGIHQTREYKRFYPEGEAMAHIVGFTNVEDRGQEGVELARESGLAGRAGARQVIKDRLGRVVEDIGVLKTPRDGEDIQLSIDAKIQYLAYNELKAVVDKHKAKAASAVVLDAQTGEVLALANWPTYNPNDRTRLSGEQLRNRVLTDTFEPGSMMKPITVGLALQLKRVSPSTVIATTGKYNFEGATITDTHNYGALTVTGVIQKSSNIGTTKIAMMMKPQEMWDMYTSIGLGQAPKIGFPGAVAGRVRPYKSWRPIEQATMSYGYGLSVSLFQMAHAYTIFAHDGELIPVTMFRTNGPATGERILSPQVARDVRAMMETVTAPGGTAPEAQVMGYRVGGKTGTAYKHEGRGYNRSKYRASFIGLAPMSNPRIIVAVSVDEPTAGSHYGGLVAGPAFAAITGGTLRALNVQPDSPIRQLVVSDKVQESEPWSSTQ
ncbi:division-specific transpeptidase, penicillin-binding protein 3 [Cupriavidus taiwanensis]|uniref:Peptidoglycan D,D-transpeptidase FtsI n=2 Tax=Cupriavidus TaxID=106589 RepID=A0A375E3W9_9BURK|nr:MULTISPECIES: penicillin-binding protein 2 [Cupriavidus]PZX29023.1 peptidoglycan synthetase FtsI [Cupriavidus alkaliphilus]SOY60492.1 division-specific transpeptidase, penicillin-binding protein 3 [Cupriavidus taiwanensis]SOZ56850.1 division-specific transpeptidase, penicillin-binding protein 3 [Cupriavidus taiwanensis]SOZ57432.1 division-specific transpeptidase, penicillin-binding protein 3 [Cupriavidus taiwanensis]SOZ60671.1 division-specific transpeptidase, penicillin-binding protein 3 [